MIYKLLDMDGVHNIEFELGEKPRDIVFKNTKQYDKETKKKYEKRVRSFAKYFRSKELFAMALNSHNFLVDENIDRMKRLCTITTREYTLSDKSKIKSIRQLVRK